MIWSARKQGVVATSTTEAEYIAACEAAKCVTWSRGLLEEIGVIQNKPTILFCDNAATEKLIKNPVIHRRTRHIGVNFHYVRRDGIIDVEHISTENQLADIFTKPLAREKVTNNRNRLGMI